MTVYISTKAAHQVTENNIVGVGVSYLKSELTGAIRRHEKLLSGILLCLVIFFIWSWVFNIQTLSAWRTPIGYQGDAWLAFAIARAYMTGEITPFFYQNVPTLNAPFVANWNDYPITEDFVYAGIGWLGKAIGLYAAANFMVLLAHLMAGLSFWYVCRELKYKPVLAFAGAIVYAFCHYIMARGLGHLVLSYFWHIPLLLLVTWWAFSKEPIPFKSKKFTTAAIIASICGLFNPYYTGMFLQFLGLALLLHVSRKQYSKATFPLILILITFAAFFLMNANVIIYSIINGSNSVSGARNLASLEVYGLKIPELIFSPGNHPLTSFVNFGQKNYYIPAFVKGEFWSPYLGFASLAGFLLLLGTSMYRLLQGKLQLISIQFWLIIWILLYSMIGGFNLLLGTFGFEYFRATNRYSIFILTISLLFLIKFLSRNCPKALLIPLALLIVATGLAEELTGRYLSHPPVINPIVEQVDSDKNFALSVEHQMPNSMVFQLPVADFPEIGPINKMTDYEHFRPYFYTQTLHYSYGTNKGRGDTDWQTKAAMLPPSELVSKLESYGFGVVMINRKGYVDGGKSLIEGMTAEGKSIIAESKDLVALRLHPSSSPEVIDSWLSFGAGWSDDEGTHRWSESSNPKISITNNAKYARPYILEFKLSALNPRVVDVSVGDAKLNSIKLAFAGEEKQFPPTKIMLQPGKTSLIFATNTQPVSPQNGDPRMLFFRISNFHFQSEESLNKPISNKDKLPSKSSLRVIKTTKAETTHPASQDQQQPISLMKADSLPHFSVGWSDDEGTHRWSDSSHAKILISNNDKQPRPYTLEFKMASLTPRLVNVSIGDRSIGTVNIESTSKQIKFLRAGIMLPPGKTVLSLDTDTDPVIPHNGDERMLSFKISDLNFVPD